MPRCRTPSSFLRTTVAALGLAAVGCSTPRTRPVVEVDPLVTKVEVAPDADGPPVLPVADEAPGEDREPWGALSEYLEGVQSDRAATPVRRSPFDKLMGDEGPKQLDPELGPIDFGLPLAVNFGANEAPYDDAMPTVHAVVPGKPGFSDSVLQVSWRERIGSTYSLHGTAAYTRFQDIAIVEGISDARFAFFVVGVHASF